MALRSSILSFSKCSMISTILFFRACNSVSFLDAFSRRLRMFSLMSYIMELYICFPFSTLKLGSTAPAASFASVKSDFSNSTTSASSAGSTSVLTLKVIETGLILRGDFDIDLGLSVDFYIGLPSFNFFWVLFRLNWCFGEIEEDMLDLLPLNYS